MTPDPDLRTTLRFETEAREPAFDDVTTRIGRHRRRARLGALVVGLAVLAVPLAIFVVWAPGSSPNVTGPGAPSAALVLDVQCGPAGLSAGDSVQATKSGVDYQVVSSPGFTAVVDGHGGVSGEIHLPTRPGTDSELQCLGPNLDTVGKQTFVVTDPHGYWIPPFQNCSESTSSEGRPVGARPDLESFGEAAFGAVGARETYAWTGYQSSKQELHVDLFHEGTSVASAMFEYDGRTWLLTGRTGPC